MTGRSLRKLTLVGAIAALAAGCGSNGDEGEPVPAEIREQLEGRLSEAQRRLDDGSAGACADIVEDTEPEVTRVLDSVPDDVDADVRNALNEGFAHLFDLVSQRCDELEGQETDTDPDTQTTEETPPPDTTTTEETTPTTPSDTETAPEPAPTTPDDDGGGGGGNGNGNGGSGGGGGGSLPLPEDGGAVTPPGKEE